MKAREIRAQGRDPLRAPSRHGDAFPARQMAAGRAAAAYAKVRDRLHYRPVTFGNNIARLEWRPEARWFDARYRTHIEARRPTFEEFLTAYNITIVGFD